MGDQTVLVDANLIDLLSSSATTNHSLGQNTMIGMAGTLVGIKDQTFGIAKSTFGDQPVQGVIDPNNNDNAEYFDKIANITREYDNYDVAKQLFNFKDIQNFLDIKFQFLNTKIYGLTESDVIPQTLSQQTDDISGQNNLKIWVEKAVNGSYPYPGETNKDSLITFKVNNMDITDTNNLANKAVDLLSSSENQISIKNIFTQYKSM